MKDAVRVLAAGTDKKLKKLSKVLPKKFVFLNVYCRSVKEEHDPRGPDGPYQFTDRSVPVLVVKRWDGKTFKQQLGWSPSAGAAGVARILEKAAKENGPIAPPKALRPLLKEMAKVEKAIAGKRTANAIRGLNKVVKLGSDRKKFADGPPEIAIDAKNRLATFANAAAAKIDALQKAETDPKALEKAYRKLLATYRGLPDIEKRLREALRVAKAAQ